MNVFEATPSDLTEFVIWLCNPYRDVESVTPIYQPSLLRPENVYNLIHLTRELAELLGISLEEVEQ